MERLHQANQRLHDARLAVEQAMEGTDYRHQERVTNAEDQLREVKKELEQIDEAIWAALHPKTLGGDA